MILVLGFVGGLMLQPASGQEAPVIIESSAQAAPQQPPLSLAEAAELMKARGGQEEFPEARVLAAQGDFAVTEDGGQIRAKFTLEQRQAVVTSVPRADGWLAIVTRIPGLQVDALYEPVSQEMRLDGHGGAMSLEGRLLLMALGTRLDAEQWSAEDASMEKHMPYRIIALLVAAPVGYQFHARTITPTVERFEPY